MRPTWIDIETGREILNGSALPIISSAESPWTNLYLEKLPGMPVDQVNVAALKHLLVVQLDRPTHYAWTHEGALQIVRLPAGHISLFPAMQPYSVRCQDTREFLRIALKPTFFRCCAEASLDTGPFELVARQGVHDPLVRGIALALLDEVYSGYPGGRWYGESLASTLAVHLVRHYSTLRKRTRLKELDVKGLPRPKLRATLEYVEAHLAENITLKCLADRAELSLFHFARLFKHSLGLPPHQFVTRRRVERARELLKTSRQSVAQIAQQVGFCDPSHLTLHFKRTFGMAPKQFARQHRS